MSWSMPPFSACSTRSAGDKALAGKMLGISRATLYRKIKRYGIETGPRGAPMAKTASAEVQGAAAKAGA